MSRTRARVVSQFQLHPFHVLPVSMYFRRHRVGVDRCVHPTAFRRFPREARCRPAVYGRFGGSQLRWKGVLNVLPRPASATSRPPSGPPKSRAVMPPGSSGTSAETQTETLPVQAKACPRLFGSGEHRVAKRTVTEVLPGIRRSTGEIRIRLPRGTASGAFVDGLSVLLRNPRESTTGYAVVPTQTGEGHGDIIE